MCVSAQHTCANYMSAAQNIIDPKLIPEQSTKSPCHIKTEVNLHIHTLLHFHNLLL